MIKSATAFVATAGMFFMLGVFVDACCHAFDPKGCLVGRPWVVVDGGPE